MFHQLQCLKTKDYKVDLSSANSVRFWERSPSKLLPLHHFSYRPFTLLSQILREISLKTLATLPLQLQIFLLCKGWFWERSPSKLLPLYHSSYRPFHSTESYFERDLPQNFWQHNLPNICVILGFCQYFVSAWTHQGVLVVVSWMSLIFALSSLFSTLVIVNKFIFIILP